MNIVSEHWQDDWLRANWHLNPRTAGHAYELGMISTRQYLDATRQAFLTDLEQLLVASVASMLTAEQALLIIGTRPGAA